MDICVDPLSGHPNKAWKLALNKGQHFKKVSPTNCSDPKKEGYVRFVCISDTHSKTNKMADLPQGDILLHAGDFTKDSTPQEFEAFNKWIGSQPHAHKVVIAGNHEYVLDSATFNHRSFLKFFGYKKSATKEDITKCLTNCTYLEDESINVCGFKIYGSPWQPRYRSGAFTLDRGQPLLDKWQQIPEDTDILLTHTPPLGYGDNSIDCGYSGCVELLNTVEHRVRPKYHVFGHIHEGYGVYTNGITTFINAAICTSKYKPTNLPIIFDLPRLENPTL
ncbi:metallophosphoesterase domain-containing protein 1-like [Glandiceps talaboti]